MTVFLEAPEDGNIRDDDQWGRGWDDAEANTIDPENKNEEYQEGVADFQTSRTSDWWSPQ